VLSERASGIDWRDAAAYAPLLGADRSLFAWEWLRRDSAYAEAAGVARATGQSGERFGLVEFEAPERTVPDARPVWSISSLPDVLPVEPGSAAGPENCFDLDRFAAIATWAARDDREHLLLSDGLRTVRLDGPRGTFSGGAATLRYAFEGVAAAQRPLLTLRRLLALCRCGHFSLPLHCPEARAARWILMLRARDALAEGADQREIAFELFSRAAGEPRWRSSAPGLRSQVQRLVRSARQFSAGGYRVLLGP